MLEDARPEQHTALRLVCHSWSDVVNQIPVPPDSPPKPCLQVPLPVETLRQIFDEVVLKFNTDPVYGLSDITAQFKQRSERWRTLLTIAGVCQQWRAVILASREHWTDMPLMCRPGADHNSFDVLHTSWLPRAYDPEVHDGAILSLREFGHTPAEKLTLEKLYPKLFGGVIAVPNWKGISCDGNLEGFINFLGDYDQLYDGKWTMGNVRYLELSRNLSKVTGPWYPAEGTFIERPPPLKVFPNLETLRVSARSCASLPDIIAPNLKRLEVTEAECGFAWTMNQLEHNPGIESFHYIQLKGRRYPDLPIPDLPELRSATLDHDFPLIKLLQKAPILESLAFCNSDGEWRCNLNFLSPCFPELKLVILGDLNDWQGICNNLWESFLSKDGTMGRFVVDCSRTSMQDGTAILEFITKKSHATPRVNHVEFINLNFDVARCEEIAIKSHLRGMRFNITLKGCKKTLLEEGTSSNLPCRDYGRCSCLTCDKRVNEPGRLEEFT